MLNIIFKVLSKIVNSMQLIFMNLVRSKESLPSGELKQTNQVDDKVYLLFTYF